jgi:hypothetical protein
MRRREFIGLLGGVAGALTCADVFAAQKSPKAGIGVLINTPTPECKSSDAFQDLNCGRLFLVQLAPPAKNTRIVGVPVFRRHRQADRGGLVAVVALVRTQTTLTRSSSPIS